MKTVKLALITAVITFTTISILNADGFTKKPPQKKIISITLLKAMQNPDLIIAMYQQLDPSFLKNNQPLYTAEIKFQNYIFRISGTYIQWIMFFRNKPDWE